MMREWDLAGRCCAGRGWWCAMARIFGVTGFTRPQPNFANSDCGNKMIPFHAIWGLCWRRVAEFNGFY